jgi:hypothetical protein
VRPCAFLFESTCDTARARAALSPARTAIVLLRAWVILLDRDDAEALDTWFLPAGGRTRAMLEEPRLAACANAPEPCVGVRGEGFEEKDAEPGEVIGLSEEPDGEREEPANGDSASGEGSDDESGLDCEVSSADTPKSRGRGEGGGVNMVWM